MRNQNKIEGGHILIVEQNPSTSRQATVALRENRFRTTIFRRGKPRKGNFSEYDLILLEHQPEHLAVCLRILERLREVSAVPVVVLSEKSNPEVRVSALESGADDFISQPYVTSEFVARVRAVIRRARMNSMKVAPPALELDRKLQQCVVRGKPVDLTARELEILTILAEEPGRNFTRDEILQRIWGREYDGDRRRVDLYISRIRSKMHQPHEEDLIRSVYGVGYRLDLEKEWQSA